MSSMKPGPGTGDRGPGATSATAQVPARISSANQGHGACIRACMRWTAAISIAITRPASRAGTHALFPVPGPRSLVP